jgi:hypothetical protein
VMGAVAAAPAVACGFMVGNKNVVRVVVIV